jgi:hypothetical protein
METVHNNTLTRDLVSGYQCKFRSSLLGYELMIHLAILILDTLILLQFNQTSRMKLVDT